MADLLSAFSAWHESSASHKAAHGRPFHLLFVCGSDVTGNARWQRKSKMADLFGSYSLWEKAAWPKHESAGCPVG